LPAYDFPCNPVTLCAFWIGEPVWRIGTFDYCMNPHFLNKRFVYVLGCVGLIPFVALALACWVVHPSWLGPFIKGQLAYAVVVLSFLGGIHWGAAIALCDLTVEHTRKALAWSVTPALIAWFATMLGGFGFAVLMAGFIAAYQVDKRLFAWYRLPDWFLRLRLYLTCVVVAMLALTVFAANVRG
jgi:hypothetical protein